MKIIIKYVASITLIIILILSLTQFLFKDETLEVTKSVNIHYRFCPKGSLGRCYTSE